MSLKERIQKGINAYIKNDAKSAAIATIITNKDCTTESLLKTNNFDMAALGLMPLINNKSVQVNSKVTDQAIHNVLMMATSGKLLYLLCGPSASGKDTLASYAKHSLYLENKTFSYINKYTTRQRRGSEAMQNTESYIEPSGNYEYFETKNDMIDMRKDIALSYTIYDQFYAFSGNHLLSNSIDDRILMAIYGRFENIHKIRREIFYKYKRIPFSILLTASADDLEGRILRRHSLSVSAKGRRVKEMKKQVNFIENNPDLIKSGFDLLIENNDEKSVKAGQLILTEFINYTMKLYAKK